MFNKCRNTKAQGTVGLGSAIEYFTRNNYIVSLPLNDSQDYDMIVDGEEGLKKVQVRTSNAKSKHNSYNVSVRVSGGSATKKSQIRKAGTDMKYDLLFVLCGDGTKYLIPKEQFKNNRSYIVVGNKSFVEYKVD